LQGLLRFVQTLLQACLSGMSGGHRLDQQAAFFPGLLVPVHQCRQQLYRFIALSNAEAFSVLIGPHDLDQTGSPMALLLNRSCKLFWWNLHCREGTHIKIPLCLNAGTRLHGCQFAIPHIQQPVLLESVPHTGNDGQIHGIIGVLTGKHFRGQGHSQRVQAGKHHFEWQYVKSCVKEPGLVELEMLVAS
jgi:hypothetical protein